MKTPKITESGNQVLVKVATCLYRSVASNIYYGIYKRTGKQVKRSLKTTDKELAKRRLEHLREKVAQLNTKRGSNILFDDLAKRWLEGTSTALKESTRQFRAGAIARLSRFFNGVTVRSITKSQAEQWAAQRSKQVGSRAFNIERETLIQVLNYAVREGLILENPALVVPRRKQQRPQIVMPTKDQFRAMVAQMRADSRSAEAANFAEFLAYSGCRLGEATTMVWGDVNFEMKSFTITGGKQGTKNHEARTVPLFPPLERLMLAMRETRLTLPRPTDRIFPIQSSKTAIGTACKKATLPHFTHHSLRHFFCSNAIEAGADFKVIAGWLGHKDGGILVAKTYGHLRDEHSTMMAQRMTFDLAKPETEPANA
jgi:integrase